MCVFMLAIWADRLCKEDCVYDEEPNDGVNQLVRWTDGEETRVEDQ